MTTVTRSDVHRLVDELPEADVQEAAELINAYRRGDRVLIRLLTAPVVPAEPDESAALAELTDDDRNDIISAEELQAPPRHRLSTRRVV